MSRARGNSHSLHYVLIAPDAEVYLLVNRFEKPVHNAVRCFFFSGVIIIFMDRWVRFC